MRLFLPVVLLLVMPAAGASTPEAFEDRLELAAQFVIALPVGWSVYRQNPAPPESPDSLGLVIFTSVPLTIAAGYRTPDPAEMAKIDTGQTASFFVDRKPADKGMSCERFTRKAAYELGMFLKKHEKHGAGQFAAIEPEPQPIDIGGCAGLRFRFDSQGWMTEVRAVSDGSVLYLFTLRNRREYFDTNFPVYDVATSSVRFTAER
jgi:hypothetical protein